MIPGALLAVLLWLGAARGELWLGQNYDPSYLYLFGALELANGVATPFVDHPGVPAQLLGAGVLRARETTHAGEALEAAVLADPESALAAVVATLVALHLLVSGAAGCLVLRRTGSFLRAGLTQSSVLLSATLATNLCFFKPEALLASLMLLAGALAVSCAESAAESRVRVLLLAVIVGTAVATKITAAPFLLLLAVGPRRATLRLAGLASAVATALLASWPWSDRLSSFAGYLARLATRRGQYGHGETGVEDPARLLAGMAQIASREPLLVVALLAGAWTIWSGRGAAIAAESSRDRRRWLLALVSSCTALAVLASKQPNSRFLVPALAAVGPIWALVVVGSGAASRARRLACGLAIGAGFCFVTAPTLFAQRERWQELAAQGRAARAASQRLAATGTRVIPYFWASSPELALWLGNRAVRFRYAPELERLHPEFVVFDVWRWGYRPFSGALGPIGGDSFEANFVLHGKRLDADGQLGAITVHRDRSLLPPFGVGHPASEFEETWAGSAEAFYRRRVGPGQPSAQ